MNWSQKNRSIILKHLQEEYYDLVIIGGGITGAGILLDARSRGLKSCLVEMNDFAAGTSSRSTKLIHGGLRYLKQKNIKLVGEFGRERNILAANAPHLIEKQRVIIPFIKRGSLGRISARAAMLLYERLVGVDPKERHALLSKNVAMSALPYSDTELIKGAVRYVEYKTNDARLTIEVIKTAIDHGGEAVNYVQAAEFEYNEQGKIDALICKDLTTGENFRINTKLVVSAAGPWVDEVSKLDRGDAQKNLVLTKGVHVVCESKYIPINEAIYFDTQDKRMVFMIPHRDKIYIGTTDTFYRGAEYNPEVSEQDVNYLVKAINWVFPKLNFRREYICSSWAGLRPLIYEKNKKPSEISRRDELYESKSGLITIAGGKLSGYRKMSERTVDFACEKLGYSRKCGTKNFPLSGSDLRMSMNDYIEKFTQTYQREHLSLSEVKSIVRMLGSNAHEAISLLKEHKHRNAHDLPLHWFASLLYSIEHEMIYTVVDFVKRRRQSIYFELDKVEEYKYSLLRTMQKFMSWSNQELEENQQLLEEELLLAKSANLENNLDNL